MTIRFIGAGNLKENHRSTEQSLSHKVVTSTPSQDLASNSHLGRYKSNYLIEKVIIKYARFVIHYHIKYARFVIHYHIKYARFVIHYHIKYARFVIHYHIKYAHKVVTSTPSQDLASNSHLGRYKSNYLIEKVMDDR
jgi:hypothetical protein